MIRRLATVAVGPGGLLLAAVPVKQAEASVAEVKTDTFSSVFIRKPSELPIYKPLYEQAKPPTTEGHGERKVNVVEENVEGVFRAVRVEVNKVVDLAASNKESINDGYNKVKAETKFIREYLNKEENSIPRVGAVILGGMSGIIMGVRGGILRKIFYGSIGSGIMGSICYPKDAEKIAQQSLVEVKKLATVGVNFVYGVKPGDDAPPVNFPKIPTSVSEIEAAIGSTFQSVKNRMFPEK